MYKSLLCWKISCYQAMKTQLLSNSCAKSSHIEFMKTSKRNNLLPTKSQTLLDCNVINSYSKIKARQNLSIFSYNPKEHTNIHSLKQQYDSLKSKQKFNISLSSKLVVSYINENLLDEANEVIERTRLDIKHFFIKSSVIKLYIDKCIELNLLSKAINCIQREVNVPKDARVLASTLIDLSIALAESGRNEDAISLIKSVKVSKIFNDRRDKEFNRFLDYCAQKGDEDRLQGIN